MPSAVSHHINSAHHWSQRHVKSNKNHPNPSIGFMDRSPFWSQLLLSVNLSPPLFPLPLWNTHPRRPRCSVQPMQSQSKKSNDSYNTPTLFHHQNLNFNKSANAYSSWQDPGYPPRPAESDRSFSLSRDVSVSCPAVPTVSGEPTHWGAQPACISHTHWPEVIATRRILPHCVGQERGGTRGGWSEY